MQGQAQRSLAACDLQTHRLHDTRSRLGAFSNSGLPRPPSTGHLSQPDSLPIPCPALKEGAVGGREGLCPWKYTSPSPRGCLFVQQSLRSSFMNVSGK